MRLQVVLPFALMVLTGCVPVGPRMLDSPPQPSLDEMARSVDRAPLSVAIHMSDAAAKAHGVHQLPGLPPTVWDFGPVKPHLVRGIALHAGAAFDRAFFTPDFPHGELWKEGVDAVLSVEEVRAHWFARKDRTRPDGWLNGWEIVLVMSVYTIDGRPLGHHASPPAPSLAYYRVETVVPPPVLDKELQDQLYRQMMSVCGHSMAECGMVLKERGVTMLGDSISTAVQRAFRRFPATEVARYVAQHSDTIDAGVGALLARKGDRDYLAGLSSTDPAIARGMAPPLPAPEVDVAAWHIRLARQTAAVSALSGAVGTLQAQNLARMGMHQQAGVSAMVAQINTKRSREQIADLQRLGLGGLDSGTQGILVLLGGIGSYSDYRAQRNAAHGIVTEGLDRCGELMSKVHRALDATKRASPAESREAVTAMAGEHAGRMQGAVQAYQRIYDSYCRAQ